MGSTPKHTCYPCRMVGFAVLAGLAVGLFFLVRWAAGLF
jgi:hypothetical protein